ncbi:hypothetical protein [Synechococcus lacustris]|uniref:hypothetical protein n=1 Tax=Synechococcus lacustris TaxID=2116544 RepID=UPI0020CEE8B7|nr:hypothetical protein [Synechococcus lacustris]MCP9795939.1 hypothetical protein [Synechococcus lacustris L1F-Slac]MCP9815034.1 hypothetical protein [Synechococcus lacustris L1E-Slac]
MKSPKKNPIAAVVLPLQGRQMEPDWQQKTKDFGGNFDRRDLENMWRNPQWSSKLSADNVDNIIRNGRLSSTTASGI